VTSYRLPDEPGSEVEAVRVADTGQRWNRIPRSHQLAGFWVVDNPVAVPPPHILTWDVLVAHGKHLVDAEPLWSEGGVANHAQ
jgi:hypothetical protein